MLEDDADPFTKLDLNQSINFLFFVKNIWISMFYVSKGVRQRSKEKQLGWGYSKMNCGINCKDYFQILQMKINLWKLSLKITLPGEAKPRQSANGFDSYLKISFISHFQLYIDGHWIMNFVQLRWTLASSEFVVGIYFSLSSQPTVCSRFCTRVRFNHYGDKVLRAARIPGSWAG